MSTVALATEGLTKRFGPLTAVDGLSLEIHEGEVLGFLGPNGAGKTTSISMMCGLLAPDAGRTLVRGRPIAAGSADARTQVGLCPQEIVVWKELTCLEQLVFVGEMYGLAAAVARKHGTELLEQLGLGDRHRSRARTLSGGMQRRLNLALALVHDPAIVVLDEPEAGLDPQSRILVREFIAGLAHKKTVILTSHNMDEAERVADRVAIVDHGKLLRVDTPEALKREVGEGDTLELELGASPHAEQARAAVAALIGDATLVDGTLVVRAPGLVERLADVMRALDAAGAPPREVRMRQNTLEDVFIALTGRRLRS